MRTRYKLLLICTPLIILSILLFNYYFYQDPLYFTKPGIVVENIKSIADQDNDGISDPYDLVQGARQEVENKTSYRSAYYIGGYPPKNEGVCTDVIIRAMLHAGYTLKDSLDKDVKTHPEAYSATIKKPDPNIDFRRVRNQITYFRNNVRSLTLEVIPFNQQNLAQWQPGDIVILKKSDHVGIISDKRRKDGVPYVIHNSYPRAKENDRLLQWYRQDRIIGHFRIYEK